MASVVTVSVIVLRLCSLLESMVRLRTFNIHRTFQCTKSSGKMKKWKQILQKWKLKDTLGNQSVISIESWKSPFWKWNNGYKVIAESNHYTFLSEDTEVVFCSSVFLDKLIELMPLSSPYWQNDVTWKRVMEKIQIYHIFSVWHSYHVFCFFLKYHDNYDHGIVIWSDTIIKFIKWNNNIKQFIIN